MDQTKRQPRKPGWRFAFLALLLAVVISGLVRSLWLDIYFIPSESMEPLLEGGDRILVSRTDFTAEPIRRGDVVVFDGRGTFAPLNSGKGPLADAAAAATRWLGLTGSDTTYVKRVIGVPGDSVVVLRCGRESHRQRSSPWTNPMSTRETYPARRNSTQWSRKAASG